jgi:hypothetical protein
LTLTVLSVAYPFAPVTDDPVGGAEQVLAQLDRALAAAGWRSLVLAQAGSRPAGELIPIPAVIGPLDAAAQTGVHRAVRARLAEVLARERVDVIHLHGVDFDAYLPAPGPPCVITLHLPFGFERPGALPPRRPDTWLVPSQPARPAARPRACRCSSPSRTASTSPASPSALAAAASPSASAACATRRASTWRSTPPGKPTSPS